MNILRCTLILNFWVLTHSAIPFKLPCPLQWSPYSTGDDFPANVIGSTNNNFYGRKLITSGKDSADQSLGVVDGLTRLLFLLSDSGQLKTEKEFDILINPFECTLTWTFSTDSRITDLGFVVDSSVLGRTSNDDAFLGFVNPTSKILTYFDTTNKNQGDTSNYDVLLSYSDGLSLTLDNFVFEKSPGSGNLDFMGMDEIYNMADITITQTISHEKTVEEGISLSSYEKNGWELAGNVNTNIGMPGFGVSAKHEKRYSEETTCRETYSYSRSRKISTSRTIIVPAQTSVHVCTVIGFVEGFSSDYVARSSFKVKGWSGEEVKNLLVKEDAEFEDLEVHRDAAIRFVSGKFEGSVAMNTKMIIVPPEAVAGCTKIQKDYDQRKKPNFSNYTRKASIKCG